MAQLVNNLGGAAGFGENVLIRNDDGYQSYLDITPIFGDTGLNFFGTTYTQISINNNGNITFGGDGLYTYTPFGLATGGYPIIAPFFADVDTRGGASTATSGGTSTGSNQVYYDFDPTGNGTLTVTWDDVGYYNSSTDKLNAFQLQLIGTGNGNFDIAFNYEDINWTTGSAYSSGGVDGLGGVIARAGYSVGDGSFWYELPQSGNQDGMLGLESLTGSNGIDGYFYYSMSGGGAGNDALNGTGADDLLSGGLGDDILDGGLGNDVLNGGSGNDHMYGGSGDDLYVVDSTGDVISESNGNGTDTVYSSIAFLLPNYFEYLFLSGVDNINATGNSLGNLLRGNEGNNILDGGAGLDGIDFSMSTGGIIIDLSLTSGQYNYSQGTDIIRNIENIIGSMYSDYLSGNKASNILDGGAGGDTMDGGKGNDLYYIDSSSDNVNELTKGGTDTVVSSITYTLGSDIENLTLVGTNAIDGTGNSLKNTLTGNNANNVLDGGLGNDIMIGGSGDDTYYVDTKSDKIVELADGGADTAIVSCSYVLANEVENLITANGTTTLKLTGNNSDNIIIGNNGNSTISALAGNDTIIGGQGIDTLTGGIGADSFVFAAGDSNVSAADIIKDFKHSEGDTIDLSGMDADTISDGFQAFNFIGTQAFSNTAGELHVVSSGSKTIVTGDTNGDGISDFGITLIGVVAANVVAEDFVLS